jgi:hypothetical protein
MQDVGSRVAAERTLLESIEYPLSSVHQLG